jgi:hypothetical protein
VRYACCSYHHCFVIFLSVPPYSVDRRKSHVTTAGQTCFIFTTARPCLARSDTKSNRRDVRKTCSGKQTYLHINQTQVAATRRHAVTDVVTITISLHMQKSRSDLASNEKTKFWNHLAWSDGGGGEVRRSGRGKGNITMLSYIESLVGIGCFTRNDDMDAS